MNISKIVFLAIFLLVCAMMLTGITLISELNILPYSNSVSGIDLKQKTPRMWGLKLPSLSIC